MNEIIPALLVPDERTFRERLALIEELTPVVHLDILDGTLAPSTSWANLEVLATLETPVRFELHIMVDEPRRIIDRARRIPQVARLLWHVEASADHRFLLEHCHASSKEAGLAITPHTPVNSLDSFIEHLDELLILGAEPGFSGRALDPRMIDRVRNIHAQHPALVLGFDIGVNETTIPQLRDAGITRFCAASAIFNAKDPRKELEILLRS